MAKKGVTLKLLWTEYCEQCRRSKQLPRDIRGKGFMIAIEFSGASDQPAVAIHDQLIKRGFITSLRRGHNSLRIDPPLNIEQEHLAEFTAALDTVLNSISK